MQTQATADFLKYWESEEGIITDIRFNGCTRHIKTTSEWRNVFSFGDRCVRCIDEGTPGGIHIAGSGILLGEEKMKRIHERAQLQGITSHAECGAAKLYAQQNGYDPADAEKLAIDFSQRVADVLGIPYTGHIGIDHMNRPSGFHPARVIYYDGAEGFDYHQSTQLPRGFIIDRCIHDPEDALGELSVALSISFGDHGFADMFTEENPLLLVTIGRGNKSELFSEVEDAVSPYGNRVQIEYAETLD